MQSQVSAGQIPANAAATGLCTPQLDAPLTERQMAELHEAWLGHQIKPRVEGARSGVPDSALND